MNYSNWLINQSFLCELSHCCSIIPLVSHTTMHTSIQLMSMRLPLTRYMLCLSTSIIHFAQVLLISKWVLAAVLSQMLGEISVITAVLGQFSLSILWTEHFEWKSSTYVYSLVFEQRPQMKLHSSSNCEPAGSELSHKRRSGWWFRQSELYFPRQSQPRRFQLCCFWIMWQYPWCDIYVLLRKKGQNLPGRL